MFCCPDDDPDSGAAAVPLHATFGSYLNAPLTVPQVSSRGRGLGGRSTTRRDGMTSLKHQIARQKAAVRHGAPAGIGPCRPSGRAACEEQPLVTLTTIPVVVIGTAALAPTGRGHIILIGNPRLASEFPGHHWPTRRCYRERNMVPPELAIVMEPSGQRGRSGRGK
jgi:hypothetical protein